MIRKVNRWNRAVLEAYLRENELSLLPLAGNYWAEGLGIKPHRLRAGRYILSLEKGRVTGVAASFNDGNCMAHAGTEAAAEELASYAERWYFHSVWCFGMTREGAEMFPKWAGDREMHCVPHEMYLREQPVPHTFPEDVTFADARDLTREGKAVAFMQHILFDCFSQRVSTDMILSRLRQRGKEEPHLLCRAEGKYVSQCHIQAWGIGSGHIGGVGTLSSQRQKGYGRAVLEEMCRYIAGKHRVATLTVRSDNAAAKAMYENAGFRRLEPVWLWEVKNGY